VVRITVFTGSSPGAQPEYAAAAAELGRGLAAAGAGIVYGGARVGLMGVVADAALAAGGEVIGVLPRAMMDAEIPHTGLTALEIVGSMHERKARMAELADAFVALPGGLGTLDELFEILTWRHLRLHDKPVALLDVGGFWDGLITFLGTQAAAGFVKSAELARLARAEDSASLLAVLR